MKRSDKIYQGIEGTSLKMVGHVLALLPGEVDEIGHHISGKVSISAVV